MRLVLDTNTVMALWHFNDPVLASLRNAIDDKLVLLTRDDALEELRIVLAYRQFSLTPERQTKLLDGYRRRCHLITSATKDEHPLPSCRDHDDQKFLEIARDGRASLLISRDKALLKLNRHRLIRPLYRILTPETWCHEWCQETARNP